MSVLPMYISAGNRPADGPLQDGGRSASGWRTIRYCLFELELNRSWLWIVVQIELWTVRPLGADRPPLKPKTGRRNSVFLYWVSK